MRCTEFIAISAFLLAFMAHFTADWVSGSVIPNSADSVAGVPDSAEKEHEPAKKCSGHGTIVNDRDATTSSTNIHADINTDKTPADTNSATVKSTSHSTKDSSDSGSHPVSHSVSDTSIDKSDPSIASTKKTPTKIRDMMRRWYYNNWRRPYYRPSYGWWSGKLSHVFHILVPTYRSNYCRLLCCRGLCRPTK